ncbi:MAG: hypothetical protein OXM54_06480 [Acidimicrobiaceae bacterium]|nr:hypothetical protein [Acidimicrobiaceae bacterium]
MGAEGLPKCWAIEQAAMKRAVSPARISGPLSDSASSSGMSSLSGRSASGSAPLPAPRPAPIQAEHRTGTAAGPACRDGVVYQAQKHSLGGPVDAGGDRTAHPQPDLPRSTANTILVLSSTDFTGGRPIEFSFRSGTNKTLSQEP